MLMQSLKIPLSQSVLIPIRLGPCAVEEDQPFLVEAEQLLEKIGLVMENAVVSAALDSNSHLVITNISGFTQRMPKGSVIGEAEVVEVVTPDPGLTNASSVCIQRLSCSQDEERRERLLETLLLQDVPRPDAEHLRTFLANNHDVFSLQDGERGETSLVRMVLILRTHFPRNNHPNKCHSLSERSR